MKACAMSPGSTKQMSYAGALADGVYQAMANDERVSLISGHLLGLGPHAALMQRIYDDFHDRIFDPPNAEAALAGLGAGAAMAGGRPIVNLGTANFAYLALSQIINDAAVTRHMSNGALGAPVVYFALQGVRGAGAAQHSGSPQAMLWNCPGLRIVLPASPADAKGLITTVLNGGDPAVVLSHAKLLGIEGPVPEGTHATELGRADIRRPGRDVSLVATSYMVVVALQAAAELEPLGIDVEVIDPRTLVPLDEATILASVARTGRLVVLDECHLRCSTASEIAATVAEKGFHALKAPIVRIARADVPTPYSAPLEAAITPDAARVVVAIRQLVGK
jgi:acetoin:2,6-dichlorophenolindophenol oxidoreductase subunit beta